MKRIIMIISAFLALTMMPFALFACNKGGDETQAPTDATEAPTSAPTEKPTEETKSPDGLDWSDTEVKQRIISLIANYNRVRHLGRTSVSGTGIACDHTATGIEFSGVMQGDVIVKINSRKHKEWSTSSYFTVYVDGERQKTAKGSDRFEVTGKQDLLVASFHEQGEHTIRIVKQDESNYTLCDFENIKFTGYLTPPPAERKLYFEILGDSITCGMGNIGENGKMDVSHAQSSIYEDGTLSYGYITAEDLGADVSIISQSGIGIDGGWFGHSMSQFYAANSYFRDANTKYTPKRTPDVIIINLVTNDYYLHGEASQNPTGNKYTPERIREQSANLIEQVRATYGDAGENIPVVWIGNVMGIGSSYNDAVKEGIADMGGEAEGIYYLTATKASNGGAQGHPTVEDHYKTSEELTAFLIEKGLVD